MYSGMPEGAEERLLAAAEEEQATCQICHVERAPGTKDYDPLDVIFGRTLGWYSGDDGEICGQCMANLLRKQ